MPFENTRTLVTVVAPIYLHCKQNPAPIYKYVSNITLYNGLYQEITVLIVLYNHLI